MRYQAFRQISTGELTNASFTTAGDSFEPKITESRRLAIAAATGIPESDLEAIEQATKPAASKQTIILPITVTPPTLQEVARERAVTAIKAIKDTEVGRILYDLAIADGRIEA